MARLIAPTPVLEGNDAKKIPRENARSSNT